MKNNKGFTLIELLAVIVILGLLLAIAIPSITRYINQSRKNTLVSSIDSYVSSVIIDVNNQNYNFSELNTIFAIPINCVSLEKGGKNPLGDWSPVSEDYWAYVLVQYDSVNFKYIYGFTFKDSNGYGLYPTTIDKLSKDGSEIKTGYTDLNLPVTDLINKSFSSDKLSDFNVDDKTRLVVLESDTCDIPKPCVGEGTEVGDLITCDTESFNIIESSEDSVTAFAVQSLDLETYTQSSKAGDVIFSNSNYWMGDNRKVKDEYNTGVYPYVYDKNSVIYEHVEKYGEYLKNNLGVKSVSASLISYEQLDKLNCNFSSCSSAPSWLKAQNYDYYWTGAYQPKEFHYGYVICVNFHPSVANGWYSQTRKVRPIVTISKEDIKF